MQSHKWLSSCDLTVLWGQLDQEGVAQAAELPVPPNLDGRGNLIAGERQANQDGDGVDSQGTFIANGGPIADGQSATVEIDIANPAVNQYLTLLAMVVPSNDTFFGNDDPLLWRLFDDNGDLALNSFDVTASMVYDAGSEVNEFDTSTQADIVASTEENGVITSIFDEDADGDNGFENLAQLFGLGDVSNITRDTVLFSVSISDVTPVPLPASAPLLLAGVGFLGWRARRTKKTA